MRTERGTPVLPLALGAALLALATAPGTAAGRQQPAARDTAPAPPADSVRGPGVGADTAAAGRAAPTAEAGSTAVADSASGITYRREVFTYPAAGRSDPFRPLELGAGMGPRFENLLLAGIIHAPEVGSVVVLRDRSTGRRHRVRDGERIGNARVLEIRPEAVVFSVRGPTGPRREILRSRTREEETQP